MIPFFTRNRRLIPTNTVRFEYKTATATLKFRLVIREYRENRRKSVILIKKKKKKLLFPHQDLKDN